MPLYTYHCSNHNDFDVVMDRNSITEHPTYICPECGMESRRVFNSTGRGIIRPAGYSLKPGDPGYYQLPHEASERFAQQWQQEPSDE